MISTAKKIRTLTRYWGLCMISTAKKIRTLTRYWGRPDTLLGPLHDFRGEKGTDLTRYWGLSAIYSIFPDTLFGHLYIYTNGGLQKSLNRNEFGCDRLRQSATLATVCDMSRT